MIPLPRFAIELVNENVYYAVLFFFIPVMLFFGISYAGRVKKTKQPSTQGSPVLDNIVNEISSSSTDIQQ